MGMRRGSRSGWMEHEGKLIAVNLGADFCAEHEWGIKGLKQALGVNDNPDTLGVERFRITRLNPAGLQFVEQGKNEAALILVEPSQFKWLLGKKLDEMFNGEARIYKEDDFATAWCEDSFCIHVKKAENLAKLRRIYDSIRNRDAAMWLGGGHVFQNAGLVIGIISEIPQNLKQEMYDAHVDAKKLKDASDATGIVAKINKFNEDNRNSQVGIYPPCGYYALSPSWNNNASTNYPVIYWLNPMDQQKNKYGWYTVEQLEQWMEGKGPVVEQALEKAS